MRGGRGGKERAALVHVPTSQGEEKRRESREPVQGGGQRERERERERERKRERKRERERGERKRGER